MRSILRLAFVAALGLGCAAPVTTWPTALPPDMDRLGLTVAPAGVVPRRSADAAMAAARTNSPGLFAIEGIDVRAYLIMNPSTELIWVVRVSGFAFEEGGASIVPGTSGGKAAGSTVRFAYIYVDDQAGEVVSIELRP